jgi:type IV secretion system protein TrbL
MSHLLELKHLFVLASAAALIACSSDNGGGAGALGPGSGGAASSGSVGASGSSSGTGTLGTSGTTSPTSGASAGTSSGMPAESGSSGTPGGTGGSGASGATGGSGDGGAKSGTATVPDAGAPDSSGAPTFTQVYAIMSSTTALCASCHSMNGKPNTGFVNAKLDLSTQAVAYTNLVGPPTTASCKGKMFVVPGNSAMSALYAAIAGAPLCGEKMPKTPGKLTMAEIMTIKAWINGGAPNN